MYDLLKKIFAKPFLIISVILSFVLIFILGFFFVARYGSAFEADRACHTFKQIEFGDSSNYGCDHDLETRQWLLYEENSKGESAEVLKRFRY